MHLIEHKLAAVFYADFLLPLQRANLRRGIHYLDRGLKRSSYWVGVISRTGGLEQLSESPCDALALLALLGVHWHKNGEAFLPQLLPHLGRLRQELVEAGITNKPSGPEVTEFAYPLF